MLVWREKVVQREQVCKDRSRPLRICEDESFLFWSDPIMDVARDIQKFSAY